MQQTLPWIVALAALALCLVILALWMVRSRPTQPAPLPTEWTLTARPVFSTDERRVYRQLREALPHHIVLSKLPLVRFCQPTDPQQVRYWYDLLGAIHITFAICSATGRVLAAIDLDTDRGASRRALQIKQAVLGACRVRYLRCPIDHMPSIPELQLLVPQNNAAARPAQGSVSMNDARDPLSSASSAASTLAARRRERSVLWHDSGFFQDSFFGAESRSGVADSGFGTMGGILRGGVPWRGPQPDPAPDDPKKAAAGNAPRTHH
ncbi:MAG: DUF2726 domain-containing protein [Rubrivivax sp.]